jgi:2-desacetyl-2-hydroxyethyl bacteriochlorophyllide A dehydrogenase
MHSLFFTSPGHVEIREETLPPPAVGEVRVETLLSAISPGTEMLVYRGQFPRNLSLDASINSLAGGFAYPVRYGYAAVGRVAQLGAEVDESWLGRLVFAFQPHASAFNAPVIDLHPLPANLPPEEAVFLPNMETAVNFLLDGAPLIGERVAVFGQGVVGLLTTALLARLPLALLTTFDKFPLRREWSIKFGATPHLPPSPDENKTWQATESGDGGKEGGADLIYELTGSPAALDDAIEAAGFSARIVVGSWYGEKRHAVDFGGKFHRARLKLISSQVSTLTPELHARWSKARRLAVAWQMLEAVRPAQLITHRFSLTHAAQAYALIDQHPEETLQVVFKYPE